MYYTLLTTLGAAALANAQATQTTVNLTEFAVGSGDNDAAYEPTEAQIALKGETYRAGINQIYVDPANANYLVVEALIPETEGGWTIRELGIFDDSGNLFAIAKLPESYKPQLAEGSGKDFYVKVIMEIGNAADVTLLIDPSIVLATRKYVDDELITHEQDADPHPTLTVPTGTTMQTILATAPAGWLMLNGDTLGAATSGATQATDANEALFKAIWDNMADGQAPVTGGRGASAQADWDADKPITLPDGRGRALIGAGQGAGLTNRTLGASGGEEDHVLTEAELASHNHPFLQQSDVSSGGGNTSPSSAGAPSNAIIQDAGSDAPHNNMQPYLAINHIIKL